MDEEERTKQQELYEKEKEFKKKVGREEFYEQLGIVQDFFSTRAVAHASFFVASIFGLFTVLAVMETHFQKLSSSQVWELIFLSIAYWSVFGLGCYSFINFSNYSNLAQRAESFAAHEAVELVRSTVEKDQEKAVTTRTLKRLKSSKWFMRYNRGLLLAYLIVAIFAFLAFILKIL